MCLSIRLPPTVGNPYCGKPYCGNPYRLPPTGVVPPLPLCVACWSERYGEVCIAAWSTRMSLVRVRVRVRVRIRVGVRVRSAPRHG